MATAAPGCTVPSPAATAWKPGEGLAPASGERLAGSCHQTRIGGGSSSQLTDAAIGTLPPSQLRRAAA